MPLACSLSYAQRFEDSHSGAASLGEHGANGFYIDIGAGHPVYDNVSFAFYLRAGAASRSSRTRRSRARPRGAAARSSL